MSERIKATQKQIDANRRNSEKSTGPKTEKGKAVSAQNALKHGMYCQDVLLYYEDFEGYETFRAQLFHDYQPKSAAEFILAEQILQSYFMSRRAIYMLGDADNAAVHGGKPTALTYPAVMKMKIQNDRIVQKAITMLETIKNERAKPDPKLKAKDLPEIGFVSPTYPLPPAHMREVPYNQRP